MNLIHKFSTIAIGLSTISTLTLAAPVLAAPGLSVTARDGDVPQKDCLAGAKKAAEKLRLTSQEVDAVSVTGELQDYSVMILCHPIKVTNSMTTQVIVVSGPSGDEAEKLRTALRKAIDE